MKVCVFCPKVEINIISSMLGPRLKKLFPFYMLSYVMPFSPCLLQHLWESFISWITWISFGRQKQCHSEDRKSIKYYRKSFKVSLTKQVCFCLFQVHALNCILLPYFYFSLIFHVQENLKRSCLLCSMEKKNVCRIF